MIRGKICKANPDLAQVLLAYKITQSELARRVGRDRSTVWRWLSDPNLDPARRELLKQAITNGGQK